LIFSSFIDVKLKGENLEEKCDEKNYLLSIKDCWSLIPGRDLFICH